MDPLFGGTHRTGDSVNNKISFRDDLRNPKNHRKTGEFYIIIFHLCVLINKQLIYNHQNHGI